MLSALTLPDLLRVAAREAPDAEAFRYRDEHLTYRDWDGLADRLAAAFAARGVGHGSVVALLLPSTPFYLVAYLAAARLGAVTSGINARYRRTEIAHILRCSGAALLVAVDGWHDADFRAAVEPQRADLPELGDVVWIAGAQLRKSTRDAVSALAVTTTAAPSASVAPDDPVTSFEALRGELAAYEPSLKTRPFAVVGTKLDIKGDEKRLDALKAYCKRKRIKFFAISSATREGLDTLVQYVGERVATLRAACETVS